MEVVITVGGLLVGGWLITILFNMLVEYIYYPKNKKDEL